ncbi:phosphotransferase [uncultured Paraglaciecola sp.]|uniref:phosphotransferase n=1 Tax=uncultured Paraglaciecola sp. TaxID=1765024 RepID=UPI0030D9A9B6|tara:strand:- start:1878 stop:2669 length:792 start_codon:yes stop_codon:yes gene_type:complete
MNDLKVMLEAELTGLNFIQSDFDLTAINGGTINSSYRLQTSNQSYFVKTFESDKIALLDRRKLFRIQSVLATEGLAVKPVYLSKSLSFQIDQWLDSPTLDQIGESSLTITKCLASALTKLHNTKIDAPELDLPSQWQHYLSLIDVPVSDSMQQTFDKYASIWYRACDTKKVFCHNDLALSHVTHNQNNKIFDWEYCAISCPYFDLASCVAVNGFSSSEEASLCAFYAQYSEQRLSEVVKKVAMMKPLVELTYKLWYEAARQSS